jgi:hypothetical protein
MQQILRACFDRAESAYCEPGESAGKEGVLGRRSNVGDERCEEQEYR